MSTPQGLYQLSQLDTLEAEAMFIMREVVAEFEKPVLLFSGGKDSIVMLHVAAKAFHPARVPSRCCMWIPATTSPRCWSIAIAPWGAWG